MATTRSTAPFVRATVRNTFGCLIALGAIACAAEERRAGFDAAPRPTRADAPVRFALAGGEAGAAPAARSSSDMSGIETVAVPVGDTGYIRGRSTTIVKAPMDSVRAVVLAFAHYPEFMPHYEKCRVLGSTPAGGRDVYMEVSALHGAVKMWARIEIPKPTTERGVETYASRFLEGNVHDLQAIWRLEKVEPKSTRLSLEVFLRPKLPLPKRLVNAENLEGSARAIAAMRARIEGREIARR